MKMKKGVKKFGALLGALLIMFTSILTSLVNAVNLNTASVTFTMPDHAVSLMAISEANGYTIIFNGNGNTNSGTTMADLSMTYDESKQLTTNTYTKVGYTFLGWSTDSTATTATYTDGQNVSNLATEGSITLYAVWKANVYQVAFDPNPDEDTLNIAEGSMSNQNFTYDQPQALTNNGYTRTGYTFLGWSENSSDTGATYTNSQSVSNLTTTSGDVVTLYAIWQANTGVAYTVKHYKQDIGGAGWTLADTDNLTGTTYDLVTPDGKTYEGFTLSGTESKHIKGDGSTVFEYYYTRDTHTVTLHEGRGIASVSGGGTYYYDDSVTVSAVLKPGYQDLEWTGTYDTATFNMPASNVDMTANATPTTYTITLNVGSGTISGQPTEYNVEDIVTIPDPTRVGYDFVGRSGTNLNTPTSGLTISPQTWHENLVYEAIWSPRSDINYVVHHYIKKVGEDLYYQEVEVTYTTGTADEILTFADYEDVNIPCVTYAGGSLTLSTGGLTNAETTFRVMPDGTTEVYLYYTRNKWDVTLTKDGNIASVTLDGTTNENTITKQFECGATVTIDAEPKAGYHFLYWDDIGANPLNPVNP